MDEKIMDLLGQILEKQTETNHQLKELSNRVQQIEINIENDLGSKVKALFDAREVQSHKNDTMINVLQRIENQLETLQIETAHLRKVK